jgi:hypothetical protein
MVQALCRLLSPGAIGLAVIFRAVSLPQLYGTAFLLGSAEPLYDTAAAALVPLLVPQHSLERANGRLIGAQQLIEVIAPPIGGAVTAVGLALAV